MDWMNRSKLTLKLDCTQVHIEKLAKSTEGSVCMRRPGDKRSRDGFPTSLFGCKAMDMQIKHCKPQCA